MSSGVKFRGVLVHVLSNGGALQLISVRDALARSDLRARDNSRQGPPTALVLDSSPAQHELSSAIESWAPSHPILHYLAIPPIATVYAGFYIVNSLAGHPPIFKALRDFLNSPNLLPSITDPHDAKATPRVYLYSDGDFVTTSNDVETHYASAVSKGFDATLERFVGSQHVTHMRADPERYWRAVTSVWTKALQRSGSRPVLSSL
ncbi:hypothetical protein DAEQUDRAFT_766160 [Daedalea quercina L-15889]|uniref:DUF829-domain-containing protein n=1 Tax=Daedalea quercina L-15889 TaxID=1314783 RepID=A0A165PR91_9APHY|nr:hypothetical protein DAEQUDRAFT_766160 [Daedalea quercina L-15889]